MASKDTRPSLDELAYVSHTEREQALRLGFFIFIASEALLFAGLFALYAGYRAEYPEVFAEGVKHNIEWIGSVNTLVLLISSFFVAWADLSLRSQQTRRALVGIVSAWILGAAFLGLKGLEYAEHWSMGIRPGHSYASMELVQVGASLFFTLYYLMTGLHALHMIAGMTVLTWLGITISAHPEDPAHKTELQLAALYWHFVDIIWVFLWPVLYLIR
jgi:cytochrome c oxidase subunit 3